jgi:transposase
MEIPNVATQPAAKQYAAYIAIDWADKKHAWAMQVAGSGKIEQGGVDSSPEAMEIWAAELATRFQDKPIAVALEQSRGAVVFLLLKYAHLVMHPVRPSMLSFYRSSFYPSGAKSDPHDAKLLLDILICHRDQLEPLRPDTVETRTLLMLVEERRKLVDDRTAYSNSIKGGLKQYFPQAVNWFDDICASIALDFLKTWPTLQSLQSVAPETLREFFHTHNSRSTERIEQRIEEIAKAVPATRDEAVLAAGVTSVTNRLQIVASLCAAIDDVDAKIKHLMKTHPDAAIIQSFPGAGPAMAPLAQELKAHWIIAALGTDRNRFLSASELQCYSGIAPVSVSSGNLSLVRWRWGCPTFIRQTFHEWAQHSMKKSNWARQFYDHQRAKDKSHHAAIRSLAFKWQRILFRCWKDGVLYDEAKYEAALLRGKQKQAASPASTPKPGKSKVRGFKTAGDYFSFDSFSA